MKYKTILDLARLPSHPDISGTSLYFNTTENIVYFHDGTDWIGIHKDVIEGGTFNPQTWGEVCELVEAVNGKRVIDRDDIVNLPSAVDSTKTCKVYKAAKGSNFKLVIKGSGKDSCTITNTAATNVFDIIESKVTFEGFTIDLQDHATRKAFYARDYSDVTLSTNSIRVKNSLNSKVIEIRKYTIFSASSTEIINSKGALYIHSFCEVYFNSAIIEGRNDVDSGWLIVSYVNNRLELNSATLKGFDRNWGGVYNAYSGRTYMNKAKLYNFRGYAINVDRNVELVFETGEIYGDPDIQAYGVYVSNNSTARLRYTKINGVKKGVQARRGSIFEADDTVLTNIKDYAFLVYDQGFGTCARTDCTLRDSNSIRHIHIDKGSLYTRDGKFTNGKEVGRAYYNAVMQLYTATFTNINNGSTDDVFNIYYGATINDSGSTITCNVPNGQFDINGRHI